MKPGGAPLSGSRRHHLEIDLVHATLIDLGAGGRGDGISTWVMLVDVLDG